MTEPGEPPRPFAVEHRRLAPRPKQFAPKYRRPIEGGPRMRRGGGWDYSSPEDGEP